MKRFITKYKKIAFIAITACCSVILVQTSFAANGLAQNNQASNAGVIAAINALGDKIVALTTAGVKAFNNSVYQFDKNLPATSQANTVKLNNKSLSTYVQQQTNQSTQKNISNQLQQFAETVTPPRPNSDAAAKMQAFKDANSPISLSTGVKASDTLYTRNANHPYQAEVLGVSKPKLTHDNYFNFDTLFSPIVYNSNQLTAAKQYTKYATKSYQSAFTNTSILSKLQNQPPSVLKKVINSPEYRDFQLRTRSSLATKSIALSNLNHLIQERTPVKDLGKSVGLTNDQGQVITNASPLQVEKHIATHRVHDKQWYKQMATASPTTIQRETLFVLAEIEQQNYQAHLDRERVVSNLIALELHSAQGDKIQIQTDNAKLEQAIKQVLNPNS